MYDLGFRIYDFCFHNKPRGTHLGGVNREELQARTKEFALRVMTMTDALPHSAKGRVIANQILRSATAVASGYRAACRARSKADWIDKIGRVLEEADESLLWLELTEDGGLLSPPASAPCKRKPPNSPLSLPLFINPQILNHQVINDKYHLASRLKTWIQRHSTIDKNRRPVDVIRIVRSQPYCGAANLDWFANAFVRDQLQQIFVGFRCVPGLHVDGRADRPGATLLTRMRCGATS